MINNDEQWKFHDNDLPTIPYALGLNQNVATE